MTDIELKDLTDIEESDLELYQEGKAYLENFKWCLSVKKGWQDKRLWIPSKVGVFLFEIVPIDNEVDDFIWIITGDLPPVYLDESVKSGKAALYIYCELMQEWVQKIRNNESVEECYPIAAEPWVKMRVYLPHELLLLKRSYLPTNNSGKSFISDTHK